MKQNVPTPLTDLYLQSLEGMQPAETDPWFYTRLRARMEAAPPAPAGLQLKPVLAAALLCITLALNTALLLQRSKAPQPPAGNTSAYDSFTSDFNLNSTGNY